MYMLYVTTPSLKEARSISKTLLEKNLVACTNIFPKVESHFRWKNKMQRASEVVFTAKTTKKSLDKTIKEIKKLHSYEVPCIVSFKIEKANSEFVHWIRAETRR